MNKLIVFSASFCKHCQPHKDRLTSRGYKFEVIDAEENDSLCVKYGVRNLPMTLVLKEGKVIWRASGSLSDEQLVVMDRALKE